MATSRQMAGLGTPGPDQPVPEIKPDLRETGFTIHSLEPNTKFSDPGPDVEGEGPMEREHTSQTR